MEYLLQISLKIIGIDEDEKRKPLQHFHLLKYYTLRPVLQCILAFKI